jgi:transposase-like protein
MAHSFSARKRVEWQRRLARFQQSGQSITAFCRQEGVSPPSFYLWRKRFVSFSIPAPPACQTPVGFRPVRLLPSAEVRVRLPGGTRLVVPTGDRQSLQLTIETLAQIDAQRVGDRRPC